MYNLPIGDYLHEQNELKQQKILLAKEQLAGHYRELQNSQQVSDTSERIYKQYLYKKFAKLFELLDNDEDGLISSTTINL